MAQPDTFQNAEEGSNPLETFILTNKQKLSEPMKLYQKLKENKINYETITEAGESDMRDILKRIQVNGIDRGKFINILRNTKNTHIYTELHKSSAAVAVLSSTINEDFLQNLSKKRELAAKKVWNIEQTLIELTNNSKTVDKQIDDKYIELHEILKKQKTESKRKMKKIYKNQNGSLGKQLYLAQNVDKCIKKIQTNINKCMKSNTKDLTKKQTKINKLIDDATVKMDLLTDVFDKEMESKTSTVLVYHCNVKIFEDMVCNKMDKFVKAPASESLSLDTNMIGSKFEMQAPDLHNMIIDEKKNKYAIDKVGNNKIKLINLDDAKLMKIIV